MTENAPMLKAARLMARGERIEDVARVMKVKRETVDRWMRDPAAAEAYRKEMLFSAMAHYARAIRRLSEQVDDDSPVVAHRAAKEILGQFAGAVMSGDSGSLSVIVEGMPKLGMPGDLEEEEEE